MPILTIDGQQVEVAEGETLIQATEKLGIYVPRYCYHPGLSIDGTCRMCLVEVEKMPKLQIACYTPAQDGMSVITRSEKVKEARQAMLEFLLINHPLDCPVCDQSGECDLQNFYMEHGQYQSRFVEDKIKRKKAYPLGPHVVLDQERCILCSRCVRFCEEVSETHELGIFERGNRSAIELYPGKTLDNPYSGNVIDICPVGALTERQFRFKCRVWYLSTQASICTGCSRGCNVSIHYNARRPYNTPERRVQRLKPRYNPEVNRWWICDEGRFGFEFIDRDRIDYPYLRLNGNSDVSDWDTSLAEAARILKEVLRSRGPGGIGVIASPQLSNEELYLIRKLFRELLGVTRIGHRNPWEKPGFEDDFLIKADKNPNSRGAEEMGLTADVKETLEKAAGGEIELLYVFRHDFSGEEAQRLLSATRHVIFQGTNWNRTAELARVVLAGATHAEKDGTFTNFEGRVQRFQQALLPREDSRSDTDILLRLAALLDQPLVYRSPEDLFMEWFGKSYAQLNEAGELLEKAPG